MRKTRPAYALFPVVLGLAVALVTPRPALGASYGNTDAAHARFITADGATYNDSVSNANTQTWFVMPIDHDHSYEVTVVAPYNNLLLSDPNLKVTLLEADGTTAVTSLACGACEPGLYSYGAASIVGGDRRYLANSGNGLGRLITARVEKAGAVPLTGSVGFAIRVVDTTQTAARWTVNGYQAFFALNNMSSTSAAIGSILYYEQSGSFAASDSFTIPPLGSLQITRPNGVAIGGQLFGGVRIVLSYGSPGQLKAQEYNFNAVTGQYLTFDFSPVFQNSTGVQF